MAVITAAGFAGAVVQLRINLDDSHAGREQARQEEEENREAMARAVGLKPSWQPGPNGGPPEGSGGLIPVEVEILNSGPYPLRGGGPFWSFGQTTRITPWRSSTGRSCLEDTGRTPTTYAAARSSSASSRAERRLCSRTPTASTGRRRLRGAVWNATCRQRASADDHHAPTSGEKTHLASRPDCGGRNGKAHLARQPFGGSFVVPRRRVNARHSLVSAVIEGAMLGYVGLSVAEPLDLLSEWVLSAACVLRGRAHEWHCQVR